MRRKLTHVLPSLVLTGVSVITTPLTTATLAPVKLLTQVRSLRMHILKKQKLTIYFLLYDIFYLDDKNLPVLPLEFNKDLDRVQL